MGEASVVAAYFASARKIAYSVAIATDRSSILKIQCEKLFQFRVTNLETIFIHLLNFILHPNCSVFASALIVKCECII